MGGIIIVSMISTFYIGTKFYDEPGIAALVVMGVTVILLVITFSITSGFEHLAEAVRLKSEFVSIASHQLRSPLSNLKWSVEFLASGRAGALDNKQFSYITAIRENIERMIGIVTDLIRVAQIDQNEFMLEYIFFPLPELVRQTVHGLENYAKAHNIRFNIVAPESSPHAYADREKVRWALENLIDNSIRYSRGGGEVFISVAELQNELRFEIRDNGVGIPHEDQKHIFKKFFRSKSIVRYETEGSGLGLYIAKSYVEKMGGKMGFISAPNKGSTFWFTLPIAKP
jgi:signal transduction histidine kinase